MSDKHPSDTDLINELVKNFGRNQETLAVLVQRVEHESKHNLDPIAQSKIKNLRREILIDDVKSQDEKIEKINNVLKEICLPPEL